jgi:hypothetical protein
MQVAAGHQRHHGGTSFILGDLLSKVSPDWRRMVGANRALNLPVGRPSIEGATAAAAAAVQNMPRDFRVSITNAPGPGVYPISSFTWILLYENPRDKNRSRLMVEFMRWALTEGQKLAPDLGYAPLPPDIIKLEMTALGTVKVS